MKKERRCIKGVVAGLVVIGLLGLSGCGKSIQSQFSDAFFKSAADHSKTTMSVQVKDLKTTTSSAASLTKLMSNNKLKLSFIVDRAKNTMQLSGGDDKNTGGIIIAKDKAYVSGDLIAAMTRAGSQANSASSSFDQGALNKLKGKYLVEKASATDLKVNTSDAKETIAFQQDVTKAIKDKYAHFDKASYKQKGNVISHKVTVKETGVLAKAYNQVANSKKAYKENKLSKSDINDIKDWIKHYQVKMSVNTKTDQQTIQIKGADKADGVQSLNLLVNAKSAATKQNVKVPAKSDLITEKDVADAIQPKISDSSFNTILKSYKRLPKASKQQYLDTMKSNKDYFTTEQWQQLTDLAK